MRSFVLAWRFIQVPSKSPIASVLVACAVWTSIIPWPWPVFREMFREIRGVFQGNFFLRNIRNIVPKAKFFWHPKKIHAKCGYTARNFLTGGSKFSYGGSVTCHLIVPVLLPTHPSSALIQKISLYVDHFAIYRASHWQIYTALRALL